MRGAADRLDPPHLHRRLGVRGLRRREPAVLSDGTNRLGTLVELLGLTDDEVLAAFGADALEALSGELEERPELPVLLALVRDAEERAPATDLRLWVRRPGADGRAPVDALVAGDFAGFEAAVDAL